MVSTGKERMWATRNKKSDWAKRQRARVGSWGCEEMKEEKGVVCCKKV